MIYSYFVKDHGEGPEDAIEFRSVWEETDANEIAKDAAEHAWDENDGWEWLKNGAVLTICKDGKPIGDFVIEIEFFPSFYASPTKE